MKKMILLAVAMMMLGTSAVAMAAEVETAPTAKVEAPAASAQVGEVCEADPAFTAEIAGQPSQPAK